MPRLLRMPEVAANTHEAVLQEWLVPEGSAFGADDPIATVETEKAVVDVEPGESGVVLRRLVEGGTLVDVGAPIALVADAGEDVEDVDAALAEMGVVPGAPAVAPERRLVPDDPEGGTADTHTREAPAVATPDGSGNGRIFASPLARRLAREAGLPLERLSGTGPRGRILRRDVEAAQASGAGAAVPAGTEGPRSAAGWTDVPHSRLRRAAAARLTESKQNAPHFYLRATVHADALVALRESLVEEGRSTPSLTDLVVKAVATAHVRVPEMNVVWTPEAVRHLHGVDVAVAVATERGLLTPVVRAVDTSSLSTVSERLRDLASRAREGRLRQEELEGGSITVTNLGMYGVEEFAAIINPPQAAILAVGGVRSEPVVVDGQLAAGRVMRLTLSVDHRPVDGVLAARWLRELVALLESPARILA